MKRAKPIHPSSAASITPLICTCAIFLAGCSTVPPALKLASQGALSVESAQQELTRFVQGAEQVYTTRESIVVRLAKGDAEDQLNEVYSTWLSTKAGKPSPDANVKLINEIVDAKKTLGEKLESESAAKSAEIKKAFGEPTKIPTEKLTVSKKAFMLLAQELSTKEWLDLSWKYAKDLQADIKKAKKEIDEVKKP